MTAGILQEKSEKSRILEQLNKALEQQRVLADKYRSKKTQVAELEARIEEVRQIGEDPISKEIRQTEANRPYNRLCKRVFLSPR